MAARKPITSDRYTDAQRALADRMIDHWAAFARTGDPGWSRTATHQLTPTGDRRIDAYATHQCAFWRSV